MSGYIKIQRELIWGSLRKHLSRAERCSLIELITLARYKPGFYESYGYRIAIEKNEICMSVRSLADKLEITRDQLRALLKKLEELNIVCLKTRNIILEEINSPINSPIIYPIKKRQRINGKISSIILSEWVVACNTINSADYGENEQVSPSNTPSTAPYLKEGIYNNINKKNTLSAEASFKEEGKWDEPMWAEYILLRSFEERDIDGFEQWWSFLMAETDTENEVLKNRYDEFCENRRSSGFTNMTKSKFTTDFIRFVTKYKEKHNKQANGKSTKSTGKTREQVVEEIERAREAAANGDFSVSPKC